MKRTISLAFVSILGLSTSALLASDSEAKREIQVPIRPGAEIVFHRDGTWDIQPKGSLGEAQETRDFRFQLLRITEERESKQPSFVPHPQPIRNHGEDTRRIKATVQVTLHQKPVQGYQVPISFECDLFDPDGKKIETAVPASTMCYPTDTRELSKSAEVSKYLKKVKIVLKAKYEFTVPAQVVEFDLGTHEILDQDAELEGWVAKGAPTQAKEAKAQK
jgi:hypothetical protein